MNKLQLLLAVSIAFLAACTYTQKIRDGRTAFDRKQYAVAIDLLEEEYEKAKSRVEQGKIAYLLGLSHEEINQSDQSIRWYQIAYDNQYGVDALKAYAYALKKAERYQEAQRAFKDLGLEIGSPYEYRREIKACETAANWKERPAEYDIEVQPFNTSRAEYAPVFYKNRQLVITSDRSNSTGDADYNWTGNAFSDLFTVNLQDNSVAPFSEVLNSDDNEGTASFNADYTEVFFTRCYGGGKYDEDYCKIMYSRSEGGQWTRPQALSFNQDGVNYGHPALSADGQRLYFSSDHPDGWGGHDLYYVDRLGDEDWGEPQLMSRVINTPKDEKFPFVDQDTLYFASDGHISMGGLDIFRSYQRNNGGWTTAQNLRAPINSGGDDFGYIIDYNAALEDGILQAGYFTSSRDDGIGNDDIYGFAKRVPPPAPEIPDVPPLTENDYKLVLEGYVLEKIYNVPNDPNSKVLGRKPLDGSTVVIEWGRKKDQIELDESGFFRIVLEEQTDYEFLASKDGYLSNDANFSTKGIARNPEQPVQIFELEIVLEKIFFNQEITLENIYYDFDRADIREDAQPTLKELARNLALNPGLQVQLGSHTDCRGQDRYNQDLSQRRAQSAVEYLISLGIDPARLLAKGYGEESPAVECLCSRCSEDEHQANRRTTFEIIQ